VGVIGVTERLAKEAEQENTSMFFAQMFDKLLARQHAALDMFVVSQPPRAGRMLAVLK
jgi:hypothetical protein